MKSIRIVESVYRRDFKGSRNTFYPSYIPALGFAYWISGWMRPVILEGSRATYRINGRLVARTASYQGV